MTSPGCHVCDRMAYGGVVEALTNVSSSRVSIRRRRIVMGYLEASSVCDKPCVGCRRVG